MADAGRSRSCCAWQVKELVHVFFDNDSDEGLDKHGFARLNNQMSVTARNLLRDGKLDSEEAAKNSELLMLYAITDELQKTVQTYEELLKERDETLATLGLHLQTIKSAVDSIQSLPCVPAVETSQGAVEHEAQQACACHTARTEHTSTPHASSPAVLRGTSLATSEVASLRSQVAVEENPVLKLRPRPSGSGSMSTSLVAPAALPPPAASLTRKQPTTQEMQDYLPFGV